MRALRRRAYRCATLGRATEAPRADPLMALSTGARPGPYKILSLLRQGEIGEVNPTRDTELGREHRRNRSCLVAIWRSGSRLAPWYVAFRNSTGLINTNHRSAGCSGRFAELAYGAV
jgi:hypothetical protein